MADNIANNPDLTAWKRTSPAYGVGVAENQALVIFVLGGPGAGKGTQCANLVRDYGFKHLSAGDLLREEQKREGSPFGEMIATIIREGQIVPMEVTVQLLNNAMSETISTGNRKFLIDGFPRKMDQAVAFEEKVVPSKFTLFFDCPEATMQERLLERGKTSGRTDDNAESIKKRFRTFVETSMPVVDHFAGEGRVVKVDATKSPTEVYEIVKQRFTERGIEPEPKTVAGEVLTTLQTVVEKATETGTAAVNQATETGAKVVQQVTETSANVAASAGNLPLA